jgi:hypothetical protein
MPIDTAGWSRFCAVQSAQVSKTSRAAATPGFFASGVLRVVGEERHRGGAEQERGETAAEAHEFSSVSGAQIIRGGRKPE